MNYLISRIVIETERDTNFFHRPRICDQYQLLSENRARKLVKKPKDKLHF